MFNDVKVSVGGSRVWVYGAVGLFAFAGACAPSDAGNGPAMTRIVLLQYATPPTSADSLQASEIGSAPVTMYPVINSMGLVTSALPEAFAAMHPTPTVSDFATMGENCSELSFFAATFATPTSADSLAIASLGIRVIGFSDDTTWHEVVGVFEKSAAATVLGMVERLREDPNIEDADFDVGTCPTLMNRVRQRSADMAARREGAASVVR